MSNKKVFYIKKKVYQEFVDHYKIEVNLDDFTHLIDSNITLEDIYDDIKELIDEQGDSFYTDYLDVTNVEYDIPDELVNAIQEQNKNAVSIY